jgi:hypothetical protein
MELLQRLNRQHITPSHPSEQKKKTPGQPVEKEQQHKSCIIYVQKLHNLFAQSNNNKKRKKLSTTCTPVYVFCSNNMDISCFKGITT